MNSSLYLYIGSVAVLVFHEKYNPEKKRFGAKSKGVISAELSTLSFNTRLARL